MAQGFCVLNIKLHNFRNYQDYERSFKRGINKIVGPNATGKTNLLEAVELLTKISSFRNPTTIDLINFNEEQVSSIAQAEILDETTDTKFEVKLIVTAGQKKYFVNGKQKKITEIKSKFPCVIFYPDDLSIVKGANKLRRNVIDELGSQISKEYFQVLSDFNKALKQKNALLKESTDINLLKSINEVMLMPGAQLIYYRAALVDKIRPVINTFYNEISDSGESLNIKYYASWDLNKSISQIGREEIKLDFKNYLDEKINEELLTKKSCVGPHKDNIEFLLDQNSAKKYGSQGQQRSIVLSLKLAELKLIEDNLNIKPILLLDDVLSELDTSRQEKFLERIKDIPQTFITSTM